MSLLESLYRYLTEATAESGHASEPFARPRSVGRWLCRSRNDAREGLRSLVGNNIFVGRRPQSIGDKTCVEVHELNDAPHTSLNGETEGSSQAIGLTVYSVGRDAYIVCRQVADFLRLCLSGFHHGRWGDTYIGECSLEDSGTSTYEPTRGGDEWTYRHDLDVLVVYTPEKAPIYPHHRLLVIIVARVGPADVKLDSRRSKVMPPRTLAHAHWVIRQNNPNGDVVATISGPYDLPVTQTNMGGTNGNPVLQAVSGAPMVGYWEWALAGPVEWQTAGNVDMAASTASGVWEWAAAGDVEWAAAGDVEMSLGAGPAAGFSGTYHYSVTLTDSSGATGTAEGVFTSVA